MLAAAAFVAIVIADFTTAQAQNDDETSGRIVARLLDDGRVEFGWQPVGGERVLPTKRYFPTTIDHNRWLRSSPVEVGGTEIGRINARQAEDGRIEFAFTPTDGERITPQARYFPTGARENRWLRSTEITIGPSEDATPRFTAVSAGVGYTCAIRESGEIACWGFNRFGQTDAPEGNYTAISAVREHACGLRSDGEIACWGRNQFGQTDAPEGSFTAVSAGGTESCGLRETGAVECWGASYVDVQALIEWTPPEGSFTAVSAGELYACAIRESGAISCWGDNRKGQSDAPEGNFTAVSAGGSYACAIRDTGEIACWGQDINFAVFGQIDAPEGSFTAISASNTGSCAIRDTGEIACWRGVTDAPEGSFIAVSTSGAHTCAIRESGAIECWGRNSQGQATPPTD